MQQRSAAGEEDSRAGGRVDPSWDTGAAKPGNERFCAKALPRVRARDTARQDSGEDLSFHWTLAPQSAAGQELPTDAGSDRAGSPWVCSWRCVCEEREGEALTGFVAALAADTLAAAPSGALSVRATEPPPHPVTGPEPELQGRPDSWPVWTVSANRFGVRCPLRPSPHPPHVLPTSSPRPAHRCEPWPAAGQQAEQRAGTDRGAGGVPSPTRTHSGSRMGSTLLPQRTGWRRSLGDK